MNRSLFAFAAYNAGPGRIASLLKEAVKRDLDPDKWFNNVEIITAEKVGIETTTYVRNIFKYYTAYKVMLEVEETQKKRRVRRLSGPAEEAEPMAKRLRQTLENTGLLTRKLTNQEIIEVNRSTGAAALVVEAGRAIGVRHPAHIPAIGICILLGNFFFQYQPSIATVE